MIGWDWGDSRRWQVKTRAILTMDFSSTISAGWWQPEILEALLRDSVRCFTLPACVALLLTRWRVILFCMCGTLERADSMEQIQGRLRNLMATVDDPDRSIRSLAEAGAEFFVPMKSTSAERYRSSWSAGMPIIRWATGVSYPRTKTFTLEVPMENISQYSRCITMMKLEHPE